MQRWSFYIILLMLLSLTACGPEEKSAPTPKSPQTETPMASETPAADGLSYETYCFERVGQIGSDGNQDSPKRGDKCSAFGHGSGEATGDGRNSVSIFISSVPSLEAAELTGVGLILYTGHGRPKFPVGTQAVDQMLHKDLPTRLFTSEGLQGGRDLFTFTRPELQKLRKDNPGIEFEGYEIASAVLHIDSTIDLPDEEGISNGFEMGVQMVSGTYTVSLVPLGSTTQQYGPKTFEFRTAIDWGIF